MKKQILAKNVIVFLFTAALAISLGQQLPWMINRWNGPLKKGDYSIHVAQQKNKLTLYGTTTCPHCASARKYLNDAKIPFNDLVIDQSKPAAELFKKLRETGVPVLVSTDRLVVGFNPKAYSELTARLNR
jgi:glutaredoxin